MGFMPRRVAMRIRCDNQEATPPEKLLSPTNIEMNNKVSQKNQDSK
jgi:hypothetical protein